MFWDATLSSDGGYNRAGAGTLPGWKRMPQLYQGWMGWRGTMTRRPSDARIMQELDKIPTGGPLMVDVESVPVIVGEYQVWLKATLANVISGRESLRSLAEFIARERADLQRGWYGNQIAPIVPWWSKWNNDRQRRKNDELKRSGLFDVWPGSHDGFYWGKTSNEAPMHPEEFEELVMAAKDEYSRLEYTGKIYPYIWHRYNPPHTPHKVNLELGERAFRRAIQFLHDTFGEVVVWGTRQDDPDDEDAWWRKVCKEFV